ncbi:hypothetical protein NQ317_010093 [Molorchus minor]|uniref:Chromatin assembly factor 1 subunit A dimerization domain-containing protein n=1 Tax=Molorchus minor TaxID=1323400 RepID=A0ABQ9JDS1_9CUCU|nr:hypothetical protein NQ317_010093 [Molorchus minor]
MVTSGMSYAVHYELAGRNQDSVLQDFSRMRLETHREQPVLYVAMATWIPKCNMYHQNNSELECVDIEESPTFQTEIADNHDGEDKIERKTDVLEMECFSSNNETSVEHKNKGISATDSVKNDEEEETKIKMDILKDKCLPDDRSNEAPLEDKNLYLTTDNDKKTKEADYKTEDDCKQITTIKTDSTKVTKDDSVVVVDDLDNDKIRTTVTKRNTLVITPKKVLSPKQVQKKLESEKKRKERQLEKEEKERKKQEERERLNQEKLKRKQEKEMKEEQKRKEREEKEQKKKEREEKEEQKRKEREQEKLKKQQEIDEKNKEKQREEEKKQKAAAAFVNFFVPKKSDNSQETKKTELTQPYAFKAFEVKSDMRLPLARRQPLSEVQKEALERYLENQDENASYIKDLNNGKPIGKSSKTWPFEEVVDDDVAVVDEGGNLGETICEETMKLQKLRAKFLKFHQNRRPPYFGTWRKISNFVKPRRPFAEDKATFNYEEDSDDDWEEEEQGESLNGSDDEADKENDEKDDYEVDNDFFVPHGHLSDDEIDDEANAKLSPESLKEKLKSIGCIWLNRDGTNVEEPILRYLQPLAIISKGQINVKRTDEIFTIKRQSKPTKELDQEYIPTFLKVIHGSCSKKQVLIEKFLTYMANNGFNVDVKKAALMRHLRSLAAWRKCQENGPMKNKFCWLVNEDRYCVKSYLQISKENIQEDLSPESEVASAPVRFAQSTAQEESDLRVVRGRIDHASMNAVRVLSADTNVATTGHPRRRSVVNGTTGTPPRAAPTGRPQLRDLSVGGRMAEWTSAQRRAAARIFAQALPSLPSQRPPKQMAVIESAWWPAAAAEPQKASETGRLDETDDSEFTDGSCTSTDDEGDRESLELVIIIEFCKVIHGHRDRDSGKPRNVRELKCIRKVREIA